MTEFKLLVEQLDESCGVCLVHGPSIRSRDELMDELIGIFMRMSADYFDCDLLHSSEAATASPTTRLGG